MDLLSIIGGPILGGLGALGGKVVDYYTTKEQNRHAIELAKVSAENARLQTKVEGEERQVAQSYENDQARYGTSWLGQAVDFARGVVRPIITFAAMALIGSVTYSAVGSGGFSPEQRAELVTQGLFVSEVAITWWFGARALGRR